MSRTAAQITTDAERLIGQYEAAYERWLAYAGPYPSRERFEDALEALHAELDDVEQKAGAQ
jgi:hypothetical protein